MRLHNKVYIDSIEDRHHVETETLNAQYEHTLAAHNRQIIEVHTPLKHTLAFDSSFPSCRTPTPNCYTNRSPNHLNLEN